MTGSSVCNVAVGASKPREGRSLVNSLVEKIELMASHKASKCDRRPSSTARQHTRFDFYS